MVKSNIKYSYIVAFIILLIAFICGLNYQQWHVSKHMSPKHISLIYSFAKNEIGYGNFEKLIYNELRKQGINPIFDRFYLNSTNLNQKNEIEFTKTYLETLKSKTTDLILTIGDQATFSLLSTHHQLLSSIPVVACNTHFPDEKLISEYDSKKVYVLRDTPNFKENIDFIRSLHPHSKIEVVYNIDLTILGQKSFDLLTKVIERQNVRILGYQEAFTLENEYKKLQEMMEYYSLMPALASTPAKNNELSISLCPFRYIKGASLLVMMEKSKRDRGDQAFLLDKFDMMAIPLVSAMNIPSFSCIREGFGENAKIVGGYFATEEISAKAAADLATRLMNKEKIGRPKIRDLEKEYVIDWTYFAKYANETHIIPKGVRIINYPFYDHYRKELYLLGALFVLSFIFVSISLLRTHRRALIERKNLQMLKEAHKKLSLSMDGGQISLWNIQEDMIEFDENYIHLVGLEQRKFCRNEFQKYVHPDDLPLLSSFYETLHQSPGMQLQRIRFCFTNDENYQWFELRCSSMKDTKGKIMLAGIMQNIQELVEREQQLIQAKLIAEKAELKQSFLNNISHEIRTPLNAIIGFTNLLVGEAADEIEPEEKASMLDLVNHNNELLLKLVNDIVEISHLDSGNMSFDIKEYNMVDIVKELYMLYKNSIQPPLEFNLELEEIDFLPVCTDRFRFNQVISNFLNNANKFTQNGTITLGCKADKDHHKVCVYVKDTGKGIEKKELLVIFDRFYKTDEFEQGSGLGLSICQTIIDKLSGHIEVDSEVGKGSCFTVVLPLAKQNLIQ